MEGPFKTIHLMPKPHVQIDTKSASLFNQNRYSYPIWPIFGPYWAHIWPNLVQLTHFVAGVGSSNLIYALTVVITFRNVL